MAERTVDVHLTADLTPFRDAVATARREVARLLLPWPQVRARQIVADVLLDHVRTDSPCADAAAAELDWRIDRGLVPSSSVLDAILDREVRP